MVGAKEGETVKYVSLAPQAWSKEDRPYAGISFVEIRSAEPSPFDQKPGRKPREAEIILAHRAYNIDEVARRVPAAGIPAVAQLSHSGSAKSMSMAMLDPNGIRVELYEY